MKLEEEEIARGNGAKAPASTRLSEVDFIDGGTGSQELIPLSIRYPDIDPHERA